MSVSAGIGGRTRWLAVVACVALGATVIVVSASSGQPARAEESSYVSLVPGRVLETRAGLATFDGQSNAIGIRQGGSETPLTVAGRAGVAADAKAVVLNVAVTGSSAPGFVTLWPCGGPRPNASSLNYDAGQTISNAVTVQIGGSGQICIFTFSTTHVIIDVTGAYPSTAGFQGFVPGRILETRPGMQTTDGQLAGIGTRDAGTVTSLPVQGRAGVGTADAVVLNVAVTGSTGPGFVTVFPCGETRPNASSLNYDAGQTISNAVTAKVGAGGAVCIFVFSRTDVIIDVTGAFPPGSGYTPLVPGRALETRSGFNTVDGQANGIGLRAAGSETELLVGGRAGVGAVDAVVLNLAVTGSTAAGFVTVYPCGSMRPNASSLNFSSGQTISNAVTAKVGPGGKICLFVFAATHLIVDVTGYFPGSIIGDPTSTTVPNASATTTTTVPPGAASQFQAVYLRAIDSPNVPSAPAQIRADITAANGWFMGQTPGRRPNFAMTGGEISVVSIELVTPQAVVGLGNGASVAAAVVLAHPSVGGRYPVIFYEGSTRDGACGLTSGLGYVIIPYQNCGISREQGTQFGFPFGLTYLIAHEVTHALGAVATCAPHHTNQGHVSDSNKDILYSGPLPRDFDDLRLDFGRDDYYQHSIPGCTDIKNSPLLTP